MTIEELRLLQEKLNKYADMCHCDNVGFYTLGNSVHADFDYGYDDEAYLFNHFLIELVTKFAPQIVTDLITLQSGQDETNRQHLEMIYSLERERMLQETLKKKSPFYNLWQKPFDK